MSYGRSSNDYINAVNIQVSLRLKVNVNTTVQQIYTFLLVNDTTLKWEES